MKSENGILITGCARSGTSLVAGAINLCGAFGGKMYSGNSNNKKGMFENASIIQNLVKPYLQSIKADKLCQYPLPKQELHSIPSFWGKQVEAVLIKEGYKEGSWMFKDAKMSMLWQIWDYHFSKAKWVIVRRKKEDIVESCMKTGFMKAFANKYIQKTIKVNSEKEGWNWWVEQHEQKFNDIKNSVTNWFEIYPEKMVYGNYTEIMHLIEWLGLEWNSDVLNFIDPLLWKSRHKK